MTETERQTKPGADEPVQDAAILRRNRMQLIAIMLIGFITLGASYAVFYFAKTGGSWGTTNHGEFVTPHTTTAQLGWQVEGDQRRWWLWMVASECSTVCQDQVQKMQALHKLLNRDVDRLRRGYTGGQSAVLPDWLAQYPALAPVTIRNRDAVEDGIYIIDPNGNLVLYYPLDVEPKPVLEDLKKLLKVSQIG